jgi:hypothetical protein
MALLDHVDQVAFASSIPTDLLLGTFSGSVVATAPSVGFFPTKTTATVTIPTGINEKTLFQGVFSIDGGTTWCDFNSNKSITLGSVSNLQTQMMYGTSKPGILTLNADNWSVTSDAVNYSGSAYTFMYKVVLFARANQGDISAQPVVQQRNFSSFTNYQKIYRDTVANVSFPAGTASTGTITHDLGYVPKIRSYVDNFSKASDTTALYDFGYFLSQFVIYQIYMDTSKIYYYVDNTAGVSPATGTFYTRIYFN